MRRGTRSGPIVERNSLISGVWVRGFQFSGDSGYLKRGVCALPQQIALRLQSASSSSRDNCLPRVLIHPTMLAQTVNSRPLTRTPKSTSRRSQHPYVHGRARLEYPSIKYYPNNPYPSFHFVFHFLFHLILHY